MREDGAKADMDFPTAFIKRSKVESTAQDYPGNGRD
jgi:hypothetical protein